MSETILSVSHVNKKIHKRSILNDISFTASSGRILGLLGPNGAGKTTTMRIIIQLMYADSGEIIVNQVNVNKDLRAALAQIGTIIESPDFYTYLSGYQNLHLLAEMSAQTITDDDIWAVLSQVGLEDAGNQKVKTYSLGMRQRLGIAQAIFHHPKLLLLDEPLNGLDPQGAHDLRLILRNLADQGVAIVISSHMLSEVEQVADDLVVMEKGKVIFNGSMAQLKSDQTRQIILQTPDIEMATAVLDKLAVHYQVKKERFVIDWPQTESSIMPVAQALFDARVLVTQLTENDASLEDSFLTYVKDYLAEEDNHDKTNS